MRMDDFDKAMAEAGVSANDRTTKAYERIKKCVMDNPEILIGESLGETLNRAASLAKELEKQTGGAIMQYIDDRDIRNALAGFNSALSAVKNAFGEEKMTEAVICKAIEAGSYIAYRTIMGEAATPAKRY